MTIGIDIIIKLIGSGGVIIAANITVIIIASLLYCLKKSGVTIPMDEKRNETTGNSKITPEENLGSSVKLSEVTTDRRLITTRKSQ